MWWYNRIEAGRGRGRAGGIMHAVFGSDYFRHPVLKVPPPPCQNALFRFFNRAFCHTINATSEPKLVNHKMLIISHVPVLRDDLSGGGSSDRDREDIGFRAFACNLIIFCFFSLISPVMMIQNWNHKPFCYQKFRMSLKPKTISDKCWIKNGCWRETPQGWIENIKPPKVSVWAAAKRFLTCPHLSSTFNQPDV